MLEPRLHVSDGGCGHTIALSQAIDDLLYGHAVRDQFIADAQFGVVQNEHIGIKALELPCVG